MPELAVILVVALLVLGPRRLPEMARTLGKGLAEFRKVTGDVNKELQGARDLIEREAREHERMSREFEREQRLAQTNKPTGEAPGTESNAEPTSAAPTSVTPSEAPPAASPAESDASGKS